MPQLFVFITDVFCFFKPIISFSYFVQVTHNKDIVPHLPPQAPLIVTNGFHHVTDEVWYDENCNTYKVHSSSSIVLAVRVYADDMVVAVACECSDRLVIFFRSRCAAVRTAKIPAALILLLFMTAALQTTLTIWGLMWGPFVSE